MQMTVRHIALLCERPPLPDGSDAGPDRRFLDELREYSRVTVMWGRLRDASVQKLLPHYGFVIVDSEDHEATLAGLDRKQRTILYNRLVLLGVEADLLAGDLDGISVAAAIARAHLDAWQKRSDATLWGRRAAGDEFGLRSLPAESCGYLISRSHTSLPHLLSDYLTALVGLAG